MHKLDALHKCLICSLCSLALRNIEELMESCPDKDITLHELNNTTMNEHKNINKSAEFNYFSVVYLLIISLVEPLHIAKL